MPMELSVMLSARRSASNDSMPSMTSAVVPPSRSQNASKSSRYALYSVLRSTSMFISSRSSDVRCSGAWRSLWEGLCVVWETGPGGNPGGPRHMPGPALCRTPPPTPSSPFSPTRACPLTGEVGRQRRVHEHQAVQVTHVLGHGQRGNRIKHAQRVALVQQLLCVALVQCARHDQHHVVNHVAVRAVVQELAQWLRRLCLGFLGGRGGSCLWSPWRQLSIPSLPRGPAAPSTKP